MTVRAGIVITGTEVLTGIISDRNGPWLSDRLRETGVDLAHLVIVADRREDMAAALGFMREQNMDLVITSGGLGPTADDLTAEVVGEFQSRPMVLDEPLEQRIAEILKPLAKRFPDLYMEAIRLGNRKQAIIPEGATILDPVGTAPGLIVPPADAHGPTVVVLPGPPRELQPMWHMAVKADSMQAAIAGAGEYRLRVLRLFGIPESEIAETLRVAEREGVEIDRLEITTCLRRGEIEVVTRYEPDLEKTYEAFEAVVRVRHPDTLFSDDGSTIDEQVAALLRGGDAQPQRTIATAESCTGGLLAARLTDPPGASDYMCGAIVAYANEVKIAQAGVDPALIERHGAVSSEVAEALAHGARTRLAADVGVGITGIAGPAGQRGEASRVRVLLGRGAWGGAPHPLGVTLPGGRADIRDRATTVAMHLIRRALCGR